MSKISEALTRGRIATTDVRFNRIHQVVLTCPPVRARWRHLANTMNLCFLLPTRVHNPNGKSIGSDVFAQLMAQCHRACPCMSFPLITAPSHGDLGPK